MPNNNEQYKAGDKARRAPRQQSKRQAVTGRRETTEGIRKNRSARRAGIKQAPPKGMTPEYRTKVECAWTYSRRLIGTHALRQMVETMRSTGDVSEFLEFGDIQVQLIRNFGKSYEDKLEMVAADVLMREHVDILQREAQEWRNARERRNRRTRSAKPGYVYQVPKTRTA